MKIGLGRLVDSASVSYVGPEIFKDIFANQSGKGWLYNRQLSTLVTKLSHIKSLLRFGNSSSDDVGRFLEEWFSTGEKKYPSGFNSAFSIYHKERQPYKTWNSFFRQYIVGGWQQAIKLGRVEQSLNKYDLISAYAWAGMQGLPDPKTYRKCLDATKQGLYIFRGVPESDRELPQPFYNGKEAIYLATDSEINRYRIRILSSGTDSGIYWGVSWEKLSDIRPELDHVRDNFTDWKKVYRSYWGRWLASHGPTSILFTNGTVDKEWKLPNVNASYIWAHVILSRVKERVFEASSKACHIYVDSVITPETLSIGTDIGGWRFVKRYEEGITIYHTGVYRDNRSDKLDSQMGIRKEEKISYVDKGRNRNPEEEERAARERNRIRTERRDSIRAGIPLRPTFDNASNQGSGGNS